MKKILLIAIASLPYLVSAQKLLKPVVDQITGETTWSTTKEKLYLDGNFLTQQGEAVECMVTKTGKQVALILIPQTLNEQSAFTISQGEKAYLKLKDNSIITLTSQNYLTSDTSSGVAGSTTYSNGILRIPYIITDADIRKIESSELVFLRIETSIGNFDCYIKPKFAHVISKQVELIASIK